MSIYAYIDMNSYFASVEQQANPALRGKPIAVIGIPEGINIEHVDISRLRTVVSTASKEAKAFGVKSAMPLGLAKRLCPTLQFVPADWQKYQSTTTRFNHILEDFAPAVESMSIDESLLDLTTVCRDHLEAICIMQDIKKRLKSDLGECITASIGLAPNPLIAKMASDRIKPDGLVSVPKEQVKLFLDQSHLADACGIGPATLRKLNDLGITSFAQLREYPLQELINHFHSQGVWLKELSQGTATFFGHSFGHVIGQTSPAVRAHSNAPDVQTDWSPKSIGRSVTLPTDTSHIFTLSSVLRSLAAEVGFRLRQKKLQTKTISLRLRFADFTEHLVSQSIPFATSDHLPLFQTIWPLCQSYLKQANKPVRLLGFTVSNLTSQAPQYQSRFPVETQDFVSLSNQSHKHHKRPRALQAFDLIRQKYGEPSFIPFR